MSIFQQVVGGIIWIVIAGSAVLLIWALANLRHPERGRQYRNAGGNIPESRIIEMQPKRRIIEVPVVHTGSRKGIAAISGIR